MEALDCVVVGAGVVGLACARGLSLAGRDVLVLERNLQIGEETSSRNSEVIHAGIYYPRGSLKAALCVEGKRRLYEYCDTYHVPYRRCGKIIVASESAQLPVLRDYQDRALANGAGALPWLDGGGVMELEPAVKAVAGVLSPSTGIVDSHAFMLSLQGELEQSGGMVAFGAPVLQLRLLNTAQRAGGLVVNTAEMDLQPRWLINCAGLDAPVLARQLDQTAPPAYFARGHYYGYGGTPPFSRLVYPVAEPGGLGIHVTLDLAGQVKFGPDVEWVEAADYGFDDSRRPEYAHAIRRYFPALDDNLLMPGYVGVRPKISAPGAAPADFRIDGPAEHGIGGLVNLLGIESPGLTASLAIAERVTRLVGNPPG